MCSCFTKHHILYFIAGMLFMEGLLALSLRMSGSLPVQFGAITLTSSYINYVIVGSLLVSGLMLFLARGGKKCNCTKDGCN